MEARLDVQLAQRKVLEIGRKLEFTTRDLEAAEAKLEELRREGPSPSVPSGSDEDGKKRRRSGKPGARRGKGGKIEKIISIIDSARNLAEQEMKRREAIARLEAKLAALRAEIERLAKDLRQADRDLNAAIRALERCENDG